MHCLEVIVVRNTEAAAREAAHAETDGHRDVANQIAFNQGYDGPPSRGVYLRVLLRGLREG